MRKTLIAVVAAATVAATAFATSNKAEAWWGWWWPGAVVGGVVAGAIIGSAVAPRPYYPYGLLWPVLRPLPIRTSLPKGMERIYLGTRLLLDESALTA
jgi:hypothetical protein